MVEKDDSSIRITTENGLYQRRVSNIAVHNNTAGSANYPGNYQPFIVHTADDYPIADLGSGPSHNYQPSHIVEYRTCDVTDPNSQSAPFNPVSSDGGGKLGMYRFWNTCNANLPPNKGVSSGQQFEFYNYSKHPSVGTLNANPQEIGNTFSATGGGNTAEAQLYFDNFFNFNSATMAGIDPQAELYNLNANGSSSNSVLQVQQAIAEAYQNYISYLYATNNQTGPTGSQENNTSCSVASMF